MRELFAIDKGALSWKRARSRSTANSRGGWLSRGHSEDQVRLEGMGV